MSAPNFEALRTRAEQRRQAALSAVGTLSEAQRLVQELQLYQAELELQHEELLENQLQAETSRAQYANLYNTAPVGYCTLDARGTVRQLNQRASQLLGLAARELLGRRLAIFVPPAERNQFADFLTQLRENPGQRASCELPLQRYGTTPFRAQLDGVAPVLSEPPGEPISFNLVLLDVSERHEATEALAASEARFRATFEQSSDGMLLLDNLLLVAANHTARRWLGLPAQAELLGYNLASHWPPTQPDGTSTREAFAHCQAQAAHQGWCRLELERLGPAGAQHWDELSFNPVVIEGRHLLHVDWRDITARRLAEQQLRDGESRLQQALAAAEAGVCTWELATDALHADARAQQLLGLPTGSSFRSLCALVHPADLPAVEHTLAEAQRTHTPFDLEHRLLRADGAVHYVAVSGRFDYAPGTAVALHLRALVRDVTARRQAEEELTYKNRLLGHFLHNVPVLLARLGPDGCFREYAGPPLRRLGLADNELVGCVAAQEFPASAAHFAQLQAGQPVHYTTVIERNGLVLHLQVFGFFDAERQESILFGTDITEAEHLKEAATRARLREQQVIHSAILTTQEEERRRIAESLHNGVGQLLYATRLHLDLLPASDALRAAQDLLNQSIRATRSISFELTPPVLTDFGLPAALRELVGHVPASRLVVDLHLRNLDQPLPTLLQTAVYRIAQELLNNVIKHAQASEVFVSVELEADLLHLSVEDNGQGFPAPAEALGKGIGLAGIRSRVELLGGTFELKSRPGHGTGFFLQLPVHATAN